MSTEVPERQNSVESDQPSSQNSNIEDVEIIDLDEVEEEEGTVKSVDQFGDGFKKREAGDTVNVDDEDEQEDEDEEEEEEEEHEPEEGEPKEHGVDNATEMLYKEPKQNDILEGLSPEECDEVFPPDHHANAIQNLVVGSLLMFTVPCIVMYLSYKFLFLEHYHLPYDKAALYSGMLGVGSVYIIVCGFIYIAYKEEQGIEARLKAIKSR